MRSSMRVRVWPGDSGYTKWSPLTASPKNNARTLETVAALESPRPSPGDLQLAGPHPLSGRYFQASLFTATQETRSKTRPTESKEPDLDTSIAQKERIIDKMTSAQFSRAGRRYG